MGCPAPHKTRDQVWLGVGVAVGFLAAKVMMSRTKAKAEAQVKAKAAAAKARTSHQKVHLRLAIKGVGPNVCVGGHTQTSAIPAAYVIQVHVLCVSLKFDSEAEKIAWRNRWAPLAATVFKTEPNCLSYEFCDATNDKTSAIIYEV